MPEITFDDLDSDMQWTYNSRQMSFNKNVGYEYYCDVPFTTVNVDKLGRTFICGCQHWLPVNVGNILDFPSIESVFMAPKAQEIQRSILDNSYKYCDVSSCDLKDRIREFPELSFFKGKNKPHTKPVRLVLNIDESCNLTCPSCRNVFKFDKEGKTFDFKLKLSNHLAHLVSNFEEHIQFEVAGDGDPFASAIYRDFLSNISLNHPKSYFIINTNGLLLKEHWKILDKVENHINTIKISVDAGTEEVYNVTRRLGSWNKIISNLEWLVNYKKETNKQFLIASNFVVQKENVYGIKEYVRKMSGIGVDIIYLQKVTDWGTWENFYDQAVWRDDHPLYERMCRDLELVKDMPKVQLTNLIEYAKTRK